MSTCSEFHRHYAIAIGIYALRFVFEFLLCRFEPVKPPNSLWHGTATQFCAAIKADGLKKMSRQHVHLSSDRATATAVGSRHGPAVVLGVDAARMHADGFQFFCSENGVWLTDHVPQQYLSGFPRVDTAAADANDNPRRTRSPSPCGGGGAVRLYIGNLSSNTTKDALCDTFGKFGRVINAVIIMDKDTGRSKGFGFVAFEDPQTASAAKDGANGLEIDGRILRVDFAADKGAGGHRTAPQGGSHSGGSSGGSAPGRDSRNPPGVWNCPSCQHLVLGSKNLEQCPRCQTPKPSGARGGSRSDGDEDS